MGQKKSKHLRHPEDDDNVAAAKKELSRRRKWRRQRGYSLPAADLSVTALERPAVLLSYKRQQSTSSSSSSSSKVARTKSLIVVGSDLHQHQQLFPDTWSTNNRCVRALSLRDVRSDQVSVSSHKDADRDVEGDDDGITHGLSPPPSTVAEKKCLPPELPIEEEHLQQQVEEEQEESQVVGVQEEENKHSATPSNSQNERDTSRSLFPAANGDCQKSGGTTNAVGMLEHAPGEDAADDHEQLFSAGTACQHLSEENEEDEGFFSKASEAISVAEHSDNCDLRGSSEEDEEDGESLQDKLPEDPETGAVGEAASGGETPPKAPDKGSCSGDDGIVENSGQGDDDNVCSLSDLDGRDVLHPSTELQSAVEGGGEIKPDEEPVNESVSPDALQSVTPIEEKLSASISNSTNEGSNAESSLEKLSGDGDEAACLAKDDSDDDNCSGEQIKSVPEEEELEETVGGRDEEVKEAGDDVTAGHKTTTYKEWESLVESCIDEEEDSLSFRSNGKFRSTEMRLPPLGCSSDDLATTTDDEVQGDCYDSLEDLPKIGKQQEQQRVQPKRALPPLPRDANQRLRALQVLMMQREEEKMLLTLPPLTHDSLEDVRAYYPADGQQQHKRAFPPEKQRTGAGAGAGAGVGAGAGGARRRLLPTIPVSSDKNVAVSSQDEEEVESLHGFAGLSDIKEEEVGEAKEEVATAEQDQVEEAMPNFLWVGFDKSESLSHMNRKPKNHDRLAKRPERTEARPLTSSKSRKAQTPAPGRGGGKQKSKKGRIHSAVVSGINPDTRSVTVEWFERGETKGKEIELEAILSLNQDLLPQNDNANVIPNKLSKNDKSSLAQTRSYVPRPAAGGSNNRGGNSKAKNKGSRQTMINGGPAMQQDQNGSENGPHRPVIEKETVGKAAAVAVNRRRSNVVKEVERLKKNREERRAKQQEILEEKEVKKNIDPGNPNWEFLCMIREYQEQLEYNPLSESDAVIDHQITVCVRKRPLNSKETKKREVDVITCPNKDQIVVHEPKTKVDLTKYLDNQHFRFDYAFDETVNNEMVYKYTAKPLVMNIFEGGMATCFAYGQTGSGKTHTMGGEFHGKQQDSKNGIYALATKDVFKYLHSTKYKNLKLQVSCSYFEIYSGKVFDLLSGKSKLRVLEDGKQQVVVVGLTEKVVDCVEDVLKLINHGNMIRTSGQTSANAHSSRSHAVFQIILRTHNMKRTLYGKFSLIDLAGNERGADTSSSNRQTRMEGAEINKSLLALKECIRALGRKGGHLPFRASKLTQVLRDSFIGEKSKTCMIAMVSPSMGSCEHTLNTLRYADRVKELGAADPAAGGGASDAPRGLEMRMDDGVFSPEDSDLAQLRSMNEGELSADWYNFQEIISHLQALEEDLVESHRTVIDNMQHWVQEDSSLLAMTNEVDYDQDAYCQQLEDMIDEKMSALTALRAKAKTFRNTLNDEEAKSRMLQAHKN